MLLLVLCLLPKRIVVIRRIIIRVMFPCPCWLFPLSSLSLKLYMTLFPVTLALPFLWTWTFCTDLPVFLLCSDSSVLSYGSCTVLPRGLACGVLTAWLTHLCLLGDRLTRHISKGKGWMVWPMYALGASDTSYTALAFCASCLCACDQLQLPFSFTHSR